MNSNINFNCEYFFQSKTIEKNEYQIMENIIFVMYIDDDNYININDKLIHDFLLTNFPFIDVIIYDGTKNTNINLTKFKYNCNNIKIVKNNDSLINIIDKNDKIFFANITSILYFSFQNWLYNIRFNNINVSFLYYIENNKHINCNVMYMSHSHFKTLNIYENIMQNINNLLNNKTYCDDNYIVNLYFNLHDKNDVNQFEKYYNELNNNDSSNIDLNNELHLRYLEYSHKIFCNNYKIILDENMTNNKYLNDKFSHESLITFDKDCVIIPHAGWADVISNSGCVRYIAQQFRTIYYFTYEYLINILEYLYKDLENIKFIICDCDNQKIYNFLNYLNKNNICVMSIGHCNIFNTYINYTSKIHNINNGNEKYNYLNNSFEIEYNKYMNMGIMQLWECFNNINISVCTNYFKLIRNDDIEQQFINNIKNKLYIDSSLGTTNNNNFDINKPYILYHDNSINENNENMNGIINKNFLNINNAFNLTNSSTKMFDVIKIFENNNNKKIHIINSIWLFME